MSLSKFTAVRLVRLFLSAVAFSFCTTAASATLFGVSSNILYEIDATTATATAVGPLGIGQPSFTGLAYDSSTDTLWGTDSAFLYSIDRTTGAGTRIGGHGLGGNSGIHSLAYDPVRDTLFSVQALATDVLMAIDRSTGAASQHLTIGFGSHQSLAYDPVTDLLFAADRTLRELVTIDQDYVGNHSPRGIIGSFGPGEDILGLTYDSDRDLFFGMQRTSPNGLVSIERNGTNFDRIGNIKTSPDTVNLSFQSVAFVPNAVAVPAPDSTILFAMGLGLFVFARRHWGTAGGSNL